MSDAVPDDDSSPRAVELTPQVTYASASSADTALQSMAIVMACDWNFRGFRPDVHYDTAQRPQGNGWLVLKQKADGAAQTAAELWFETDRFERHQMMFRGTVHVSGMDEPTARTSFSAHLAQAVMDARSLDDPDGPENSYDRGRWVRAEQGFAGSPADVAVAVEALAETTLLQSSVTNDQKPSDLRHAERCLARPARNVIDIIYESARLPVMRFAIDGNTVTISQIVFSEECIPGTELHLRQMLRRVDELATAIAAQRERPGRDFG